MANRRWNIAYIDLMGMIDLCMPWKSHRLWLMGYCDCPTVCHMDPDGSFFSTKDFKSFNEDKDAYWQSWWMMKLDEGCILICLRMSQICNGWKLKWTQLWGRRRGVTIASLLYQSSLDLQAVTRRSGVLDEFILPWKMNLHLLKMHWIFWDSHFFQRFTNGFTIYLQQIWGLKRPSGFRTCDARSWVKTCHPFSIRRSGCWKAVWGGETKKNI